MLAHTVDICDNYLIMPRTIHCIPNIHRWKLERRFVQSGIRPFYMTEDKAGEELALPI